MAKNRRTSRSKKKKGRCVKRNQQNSVDNEPAEVKNAPHSFVFHRGVVGSYIIDLMKDFRKVMEPFTASSLKARRANTIKDFVTIAGTLHVSHMCVFTSADSGNFVKIARLPRGPTLYFKILNYSLSRDVVSSLKKQLVFEKQFKHSPLVIMNNFSGDDVQLKLMTSMFQNMFPSINVTNVVLNTIRRCVLFSYNSESKEITFRHYAIKVVPVGLSRGVKKIVTNKVPDLSKFEDVSEFISKGELLSESEAEDDPTHHVVLPQKISSRGNMAAAKSSIRLVEIGPRMTLKLVKIEDSLLTGEVLFHLNITKTEEEKAELRKYLNHKRKLKEERKTIQAANLHKKELGKKNLKEKSLKGMKKFVDNNEDEDDDDNDAEWYKQEVGKAPEEELFASNGGGRGTKRKQPFLGPIQRKKLKKMKDAQRPKKGILKNKPQNSNKNSKKGVLKKNIRFKKSSKKH